MSDELELTLKELAQSALGVPKLTNDNIAILHSLFDVILKKLDCRDEKVTIRGFEANCFAELLEVSKLSSLPFNDENVEVISEKLERLEKLELRLSSIESKLEKHYEDIRKSRNISDTTYHWKNWDTYTNTCEDTCCLGEPKNQISCNLLKNPDFIKKLLRIISMPLVERLFKLEQQIDNLYEELCKTINRMEKFFEKTALVKRSIYEIEGLRKLIADNHSQFISTLEELQYMLDAKLEKDHVPVLKKYIKERFEMLAEVIKELGTTRSVCPKDIRAMRTDGKCLSCGRVGGGSGFQVCSSPIKKQTKQADICDCDWQNISKTPKLIELMEHVKAEEVVRHRRASFIRKSINFPEKSVASIDSYHN